MEGFAIYLFIMGEIVDCYLNRNISPIERIRMATTGYFFLYLWRFHIETLSQKYPNFISIKQNFLANQSFAIFTSLCESMVLLVKAHRDYYPQIPFLPWLHGSESCEHFFGIARQINPDFAELIQMLPKISQYTKALRNKKLSFDKERSPNDKQISETIHHSHCLARDLAEYAGMIQPSNISIDINASRIFIESHEIDISSSSINEQSHDNEEEYDLTSAIKQEPSDDFIEIRSQLDEIAQPPDNLYTLNGGDSVNLSCQYLSYDKLDFEFLYNQRKIHEAYCSKPLERKFKIVGTNSRITEGSSAIQSNMASHFVAYFTKNENPEQRFVTQREKRWKDNRKNIAMALAQLHVQELAKSRKSKKLNKKIVKENLIEIPNIVTANITEEFPLSKRDYVFVRYGSQVCIGQVEALYFEAYNHHCYADKPIKDLNDISYISLHVFVPLHLDLFTDIVKE
ncbi:hypothetical protein RhiirA4_487934, partial [Rhizophagus irregularis]